MSEATQVIRIAFGKYSFAKFSGGATITTLPEKDVRKSELLITTNAVGSSLVLPSSDLGPDHGRFVTALHNIKDGTLLMVQANRRANARPMADGALIIMTSSGGNDLKISLKIPRVSHNILPETLYAFQGSGYILDAEQARKLGVKIDMNFEGRFMDEEEVGECFTISNITKPGSESALEVYNVDGKPTAIVVHNSPRKMRIRRD